MITRPSRYDYKYDKMSGKEAKLNYDRDIMLYEQTVALQKLQNENADIPYRYTNKRDVWYTYGDNLYDILECKVFKPDTELYMEYEELRRERNILLETANLLRYKILIQLFFILILTIISMPFCVAFNQNAIYLYKFIIPTVITIMIIVYVRISVLVAKADKLKLKRDKLVKDNYKGK